MNREMDWRNATALELIRDRYGAGRAERGLTDEPFRWDHPEVGVDELEELLDAAIYRRERYREWYGHDESKWSYVAWQRLHEAIAAIDTLIAELKLGPLTDNPLKVRPGGGDLWLIIVSVLALAGAIVAMAVARNL